MSLTAHHPAWEREKSTGCPVLKEHLLNQRNLIIASNRGPVSLQEGPEGELQLVRGGGGLVTALLGLSRYAEATWIASAMTPEDREQGWAEMPLGEDGGHLRVQYVISSQETYEGFYSVISNPLLWFLQHSIWDIARAPSITHTTWQAWDTGYVKANREFAEAIAAEVERKSAPALVMLQDYHLYLAPLFLRQLLPEDTALTLVHFIHIPWPGPEDWGLLPPKMRVPILEGLCSVDLLGFQTRDDGLNFLRTVETYLPGAHINYRRGRVWYHDRGTHVRDFPISIDVAALEETAHSEEVAHHWERLQSRFGDYQLIVRVDRTEPSKNIVRGFQAFDELLDLYPEHRGKVVFLAVLVPSRMEVSEYQNYLDELMAAAGRINARYGDSEWEPVRLLVGEDYARAVAALQLYDVLLVNSVADGMNLVAKEGPIVNQREGVVILSERTGARQQLEAGALVIPPLDVAATSDALHQALVMPKTEKRVRARRLRRIVEQNDIEEWLCQQLETLAQLDL